MARCFQLWQHNWMPVFTEGMVSIPRNHAQSGRGTTFTKMDNLSTTIIYRQMLCM